MSEYADEDVQTYWDESDEDGYRAVFESSPAGYYIQAMSDESVGVVREVIVYLSPEQLTALANAITAELAR